MRVAILWKQMSGHTRAAFRALAASGVEVMLVHPAATADAPFDEEELTAGLPAQRWQATPDEDRLLADVQRFAPDAVLVCSWDVGGYRRVSRRHRGHTLRVLCMDNAWLGTLKQWGGRLASPALIKPTYDVAFLPGDRQAAFARRLGFDDDRILWGLYTCDHDAFSAVAKEAVDGEGRRRFLFTGRLVETKGIDVLTGAYRRYRDLVDDPWPLLVSGTGPLGPALASVPGVEPLGFVQPDDLPGVFARAGCLVLPSRFEPWGVVIHEATATGMGVVCTSACGAASRLVLDGYNGSVVAPGDANALADAMARYSSAGREVHAEVARRSIELAGQFTPRRWAAYLIERIPPLRVATGLGPVA